MQHEDQSEPTDASSANTASSEHSGFKPDAANAPPESSVEKLQVKKLLERLQYSRYPLLWFLVSFLAGIGLSEFLDRGTSLPLLLGTAACLIATLYCLTRDAWTNRAIIGALLCIICFGAYFGLVSRPPDSDPLSASAERKSKPIAARAEIISAPVWRPTPKFRSKEASGENWRTQLEIESFEVRNGQNWVPAKSRSLLFIDGRISDLLPGDRIEFYGTYRKTQEATNPGAFDLAARAKHHHRFTTMTVPDRSQISLLSNDFMARPFARLRAIAISGIDHNLQEFVGEEYAPLAAALTFGQREQVDWQDQQELMETGTLHLLAISGLHVEILAFFVITSCLFLGAGRRTEFCWTAAVCFLYAGLAGGKPPVLRAAIVVFVIALARLLGRRARLANSLSFAAILLVLLHSANIANVGVHLSFLAVCSIGVFSIGERRISPAQRMLLDSARVEAETKDVQELIKPSSSLASKLQRFVFVYLKEGLIFSFWVWLMTCPLVWANFHIVSPIAIPLNLLLGLPLIASLLSALAAGLFGFIWPLGTLAGFICNCSLSLITALVDAGKAVPGGHFWLPSPPWWWLATFYGCAILWVTFKRKHSQLAVILLIWLVLGIGLFSTGPRGKFVALPDVTNWQSAEIQNSAELRCTFLDVGHGTCVAIEFPTGEVWLYDAGHMGNADRSHEPIANALWTLPTSRVERLVVSHADIDHYNAVAGLAERFAISSVTSTQRFWNSKDASVQNLVERTKQFSNETWAAGTKGQVGRVDYEVLHPRKSDLGDSDNANSICLQLSYAGQYVLLPGDLEGSGLLDLTQLPNRPCQVLMAPHHGSLAVKAETLLEWCRPELVVVSGNYRAARQQVLNNYGGSGQQVAVTFRDGAIQVRISPSGSWTVWHWKHDQWQELE